MSNCKKNIKYSVEFVAANYNYISSKEKVMAEWQNQLIF